MAIEVIPFRLEHYKELKKQESQEYLTSYIRDEHLLTLQNGKHAYTIIIEGRVLLCGGIIQYWEGRGEAWSFIAADCKKDFYRIHKIVKRFFELSDLKRIEATVDYNFTQGHRWIKSLGFVCEAPLLKSYLPNGGDSSLYVRVRK